MKLTSKDFEIEIPLFVNEIILPRYIAFKRKRQVWHSVLVEDSFENEELDELRDALLEVLPALVDGDISQLPFYEPVHDENFMIDLGYKGELSLWHIYVHLLNIVDTYEPNVDLNYSFEWFDEVEGEVQPVTYFVEPNRAKRILTHKSYTVGEQIELKEFERKVDTSIRHKAKSNNFDVKKAEEVIESKKSTPGKKIEALNALEVAGDLNGNLAFSLSIRQMAVLARPQGEILPINKSERKALISRRKRMFQEITLDVYLNVRFFLLDIIKDLEPTKIISLSSHLQKNLFTVVQKKRKDT